MTADGKALTRVCVINFNTAKVAEQYVKPLSPSISPGKIANIWLTRTHPQSKFFWNNSRSARLCDKDAGRRTEMSSHADGAFDEPAVSFTRIGSKCLKLSHPWCTDATAQLLYRSRRTSQAGTGITYAQMAWPIIQDRVPGWHNPELVARSCIYQLDAKIKKGCVLLLSRDDVDDYPDFRLEYGELRGGLWVDPSAHRAFAIWQSRRLARHVGDCACDDHRMY